ncbi:hypothetical protein LN050_07575 [Comamonadaceae bacterium M7527]|nr:hypothetical protein LN050_07575 [Comamonadaceae bacterium M7527]
MPVKPADKRSQPCPCGQIKTVHKPQLFGDCCAPLLAGHAVADTAQQLMRSRYTAYTLGDMAYVANTWHASTRPADLTPDPFTQWLGLEVKGHHTEGDHAEVSFVARYRVAGKGQRMTERSRFVREGGRWWYVEAL